jgi:hypothetical protein
LGRAPLHFVAPDGGPDMGPGGITENILAHFAGHFHTNEEFVRVRLVYDEGDFRQTFGRWTWGVSPEPDVAQPLDELQSKPYLLPYRPEHDALIDAHVHKLSPLPHLQAPHLPDFQPEHPVAPLQVGGSEGGGSGAYVQDIQIVTPSQLLLETSQVNVMNNDNVVLLVPGEDPATLHQVNAPVLLHDLLASAQHLLPHDLVPEHGSTEAITDLVRADDVGNGVTGPDHSTDLTPGVYQNGVSLPAGSTFDFKAPDLATPSENINHNGLTHPGLDAATGGNVSVNEATIIDDNAARAGLVVDGNAYTLNAIVQVNVLANHWSIDAGGETVARSILTGGDTTNNDVTFNQHSISTSGVAHFSPTTNVHVDTISGDFLDIKGLFQTNYLSNNDSITQGTVHTFNEVDSGQNGQFNTLPFQELNNHYDVIIVEGSYHSWNVIEQTNVLLNDNYDLMYTSRGDTALQSVSVGNNTLTNDAQIDQYGNSDFKPLTSDVNASVNSLQNGTLDPYLASLLQGNGGHSLNVLIVTGDFYDVNFISQTNVVSNVDTVAQYLPGSPNEASPTGQPTTSTETINSGGNQLANLAAIASVGTTSDFQYVGGQHYDAAFLVQANIVSQGGQVSTQSNADLAVQLSALTGMQDASTVVDPTHNQDLFHGVMA